MSVSNHDAEMEAFYGVIARYYDEDYAEILQGADAAFYADMARNCGGPVLEMACGTGRVLLPVARAGVEIDGMEISTAMLDVLRGKLVQEPPEVRDRVTLVQGDIRSADAGRRFRLILSAGNTPHSFLKRADQRAWLRNVRRQLTPDGALIFDVFQPDFRMITAPAEFRVDVDRVDASTGHRMRRYAKAVHEPEWQRFRVEMKWVREDEGGRVVEEESAAVMQRWFTRGELELLLEMEGFRIADYWGGFTGEPFGRGSREQVVRAVISP